MNSSQTAENDPKLAPEQAEQVREGTPPADDEALSPIEIWKGLAGSTKARIRQLCRQRSEARAEVNELRSDLAKAIGKIKTLEAELATFRKMEREVKDEKFLGVIHAMQKQFSDYNEVCAKAKFPLSVRKEIMADSESGSPAVATAAYFAAKNRPFLDAIAGKTDGEALTLFKHFVIFRGGS